MSKTYVLTSFVPWENFSFCAFVFLRAKRVIVKKRFSVCLCSTSHYHHLLWVSEIVCVYVCVGEMHFVLLQGLTQECVCWGGVAGVRFVLLGGFRNAKQTRGQKPRHQIDTTLAIPEAVLKTRESPASNATEPP